MARIIASSAFCEIHRLLTESRADILHLCNGSKVRTCASVDKKPSQGLEVSYRKNEGSHTKEAKTLNLAPSLIPHTSIEYCFL